MSVTTVTTSRGLYEVRVERGILSGSGALIAQLTPTPGQAAVVTDSTVAALHLQTLETSLRNAGVPFCTYVFPAGEASKNLNTIAEIVNFLAENHLTRNDVVIALGGGVTGDIAGFAAAVYLRGVRAVQIPTTLLAAIDSSIGGKTAVDLPAGKNLCGAFWPPSLVLCDPDSLATLPDEVLCDGCAEAIKTGVIADSELFRLLAAGELKPRLTEVITRCVAVKAGIVNRDEFDRGERALLNLGHTIGHAIEKCSHFQISHGRAVGIGMAMMAKIAARLGWSTSDCTPEITAALQQYALPADTDFTPDELLPYIAVDKKRSGKAVTLVYPLEIGSCALKEVELSRLPSLF